MLTLSPSEEAKLLNEAPLRAELATLQPPQPQPPPQPPQQPQQPQQPQSQQPQQPQQPQQQQQQPRQPEPLLAPSPTSRASSGPAAALGPAEGVRLVLRVVELTHVEEEGGDDEAASLSVSGPHCFRGTPSP